MELTDYLWPINEQIFENIANSSPRSLVNVMDIHTKKMPTLDGVDLVFVGVNESRYSNSHSIAETPDQIRKYLYGLIQTKHALKIADLGNIHAGEGMNDTLFALNAVLSYLYEKKLTVIILGGTQDLAYAQYTAFQHINRSLQMATCDAEMHLLPNESQPEKSNYLHKIISHQPAFLFNVSHLSSQQYFIEQEGIDAFEKMNFDVIRLGNVQTKMSECEPLIRNAEMFVMSMNSVRASDAPASISGNPNGLYGEEACQISRYAGMSNEMMSFGIYDLVTEKDMDNRTVKLVSQMIWYFIDGFYNRKNEYPTPESKDYITYRTIIQNNHYEIVFYKNAFTDRWWMEVPYPNEKSKHKGKFMVPCSYADYELALKDEIPDRWMKAYHKLM